MKAITHTCLRLFLLLSLILSPALLTSCGGDRYTCGTCGESGTDNPDENAEDLAEILPLTFIEAAAFTVDDVNDIDNFDNYRDIDLRIGTITEARATEYDDEDTLANIAGISAELWDDQIETLSWDVAVSDLADNKQRAYYQLDEAGWTLYTDRNEHELRRYDEKIYDFWLGTSIKWEIFEAKDRDNPSNVPYPSIAGKEIKDILRDAAFDPPILQDPMALDSALLWGDEVDFADTANAEAKIFVVYKQFRPITLEGNNDAAVISRGFYAFAPEPANAAGTAFEFQPLSAALEPAAFITEFTGAASTARFQVNTRLWLSFNISGTVGAGGQGVMLWSSRTTEIPDGFADYEEVTVTNGSYIRVMLPMDQKAAYGLETYENPLVAFIEDTEGDGANNGAHLGWYYVPSGTLEEDKPLPHYAFNGAAVSDIKTAFGNWRREQYCEDNTHDDDPGRATICSALGL